jgi:dUTP pyrophosphatase
MTLPYYHPSLSNISLNIEIMKDDQGNPLGKLPTRSNATDAGLDRYSAEDLTIEPNLYPEVTTAANTRDRHRVVVDLGIKMEVPPGLGFFISDRSGMSAKHGIHRVAGVVDADYRGQVKVALVNLSSKAYHIKKGDRIAQGVLAPIVLATPVEVKSVSDTSRGESGFGSSGT